MSVMHECAVHVMPIQVFKGGGAGWVGGVGALQVARLGRVLEGQRLENEAQLAAGHDEEITAVGSKWAKQRTPTNRPGNRLPRLLGNT